MTEILPHGYKLVQACQIVQAKVISMVDGVNGGLVPKVQVLAEGKFYMTSQSPILMHSFHTALATIQAKLEIGMIAYPHCEAVVACITKACGY